MNKQKVNLKAARLLGDKARACPFCKGVTKDCAVCKGTGRSCNLFSNPADCLAVVKMLGDKHDMSLCPSEDGKWCYLETAVLTREDWEFDSYESALAAAVMEVSDVDA